jgi:hypothetical protein
MPLPFWFVHPDFGGASYATLAEAQHAALDECQLFLATRGVVEIAITVYKEGVAVSAIRLGARK